MLYKDGQRIGSSGERARKVFRSGFLPFASPTNELVFLAARILKRNESFSYSKALLFLVVQDVSKFHFDGL